DLAVATDHGFELYRNLKGKKFLRVDLPFRDLRGKQGVTIAMVDLNNDGWLDFFLTTFNQG
ncbi:MAG: hypothetical protein GWM98_10085, partial [Nitrospinaceae bacterium]|nr:VCBS repeat-containing protein [Nitrospinaceae bacterium]NIR54771.1 VCBS repeat-containing protein [Nitrospinaceae bacterium]NIS85197.1 VCBS repeat-containing protein [Nitrospinaceae bacterium]NIT82007.1 VCBS repeat-containing protein [Nitrospinaceae bacterium]NIU44271.1 VCBS repeat-containing protein [Nitrospinaceae bacterium]